MRSDPITPREQEIFNAISAAGGSSQSAYQLVGLALGIKGSSVRRSYQMAKAKGAIAGGNAAVKRARELQNVSPGKAARVIDLATDPVPPKTAGEPFSYRNVAQIARRTDLPEGVVRKLLDDLDRKDPRLTGSVRQIKLERLRDIYGTRAEEILLDITVQDLREASLRDKLYAAGEATKQFMALQGIPTVVIRDDRDRGIVDKAFAMLSIEWMRRGLSLPGAQMREINPVETPAGTTLEVSP